MSGNPTWTILVATLAQRAARFERLLAGLLPQVEPYAGDVTVLALYNRGERPLGTVRQDLVEHATSRYVSFVDDDDELPSYHVDEVMNHLRDATVDYVGWRMQCYVDGVPLKPTYHSLRYGRWCEDDSGYYRDVSHLNPIRRDIALSADFRYGTPPEDVSWADQVRSHVHREAYVDRVMYHYRSSTTDSTWHGVTVDSTPYDRPVLRHPYASYHPASST